ncbi:endonuclease/exonuclease/phosphatase family protein [Streptomyces sp. NPDC059679]|uniref:endonuclease/exonuclease/phosphatase family protein n=1 Tax=Streptomyces sp. NPDC059679 TaxID=3346903 RepID=UPI0036BAB5C3
MTVTTPVTRDRDGSQNTFAIVSSNFEGNSVGDPGRRRAMHATMTGIGPAFCCGKSATSPSPRTASSSTRTRRHLACAAGSAPRRKDQAAHRNIRRPVQYGIEIASSPENPQKYAEGAPSGELRVVCWNVEHNGRGRSGSEDNRRLAHSILAGYQPHIVFRQELTGAWENGRHDLYEEASALGGLIPVMSAPKEGRSRNPVGVMVDPQLFQIDTHTDHDLPWKQICHVQVCLKGCPKPIQLASAHLCHFDPTMRATEARRLTVLADHGGTALIGMDANSYPYRTRDEITEPLDWDQVDDAVHFEHRTIERDGRRVSDTRPSEILSGGKGIFTDLAHHAGTVLKQPGALAATASLKRKDQGPPQRIDVVFGTPDLTPALRSFEAVATPDVRRVSDHALLVARFDLAVLHRILTATH